MERSCRQLLWRHGINKQHFRSSVEREGIIISNTKSEIMRQPLFTMRSLAIFGIAFAISLPAWLYYYFSQQTTFVHMVGDTAFIKTLVNYQGKLWQVNWTFNLDSGFCTASIGGWGYAPGLTSNASINSTYRYLLNKTEPNRLWCKI
jgi:hypothetical protein